MEETLREFIRESMGDTISLVHERVSAEIVEALGELREEVESIREDIDNMDIPGSDELVSMDDIRDYVREEVSELEDKLDTLESDTNESLCLLGSRIETLEEQLRETKELVSLLTKDREKIPPRCPVRCSNVEVDLLRDLVEESPDQTLSQWDTIQRWIAGDCANSELLGRDGR